MSHPTAMALLRLAAPLLALSLLLPACQRSAKPLKADPAFATYIPAFTAGHIPATAPILVKLGDGHALKDTSAAALQRLFDLSPSVRGTVAWKGDRMLAFTPEQALDQDKTYQVSFQLGRVMEVPQTFNVFKFSVTTYPQGIEARISDIRSLSHTDLTWQRAVLSVFTSDRADTEALERCFNATQDGRTLRMVWEHEADGHLHRMVADSIHRGETASKVLFAWDGKGIGSSDKGEQELVVPAIGDMQWISAEMGQDGERSAALLFSDPLDPAQDLSGLAGINGSDDVRLAVDGNRLMLYPGDQLRGDQQAFVAAGLRNVMGRPLGKDLLIDLTFRENLPNVRLVGQGTILPGTDGLLLPFEAVNLKAVEVRIVRIYEDNVPQFLQVNNLDGQNELTRAGRLIKRTTVPLDVDGKLPPGRWQRFHLDLADLIKAEPGAIYQVTFGFRQEHSTYPCGEAAPAPLLAETASDEDENDATWDQPYGYYSYSYYDDYDYDYDHRERNDPCSPSYYRNKRSAAQRNILASDLGVIAKRGNDGSMVLTVADLRTAKPLSGVELQVLDMQRRPMAEVRTDGNGMARVDDTRHKPFLIVARKGTQRGYLKVDDGSSLNVSSYDVQGQDIDRGLKGFLYGERGVWRPGDTLHLSFMLQQADNKLPKDHPVTLELSDPLGRMDQRHVSNTGTNGLYAFTCTTSPDAPTGLWNARVTVGGTSFHKSIRIETVKPNRLKIEVDLDGDRVTATEHRKVQVMGRWLHGAPAKGLATRVTATLSAQQPEFKGLERYSFSDIGTGRSFEELVLFEGDLDQQGRTSFVLEPELNDGAPPAVHLSVVTRIMEPGGDASMDRTEATYYPYTSYAGLVAPEPNGYWGNHYTDTTYTMEAVAVDPEGRPLKGQKLQVRTMKVGYDWWWDGDSDGVSSYMSAPSTQLLTEEEVVTDAQGRARFPFRVDRPEWGRFIVRVEDAASGHVAATELYLDWPGYGGRSRRQGEKEAAMLRFNTDRERYTVGDRCELIIPSPSKGRAFVSLENGSRVLHAEWIDLAEGETRHGFKITPDMVPNIYAHVMLVQPHGAVPIDNDLPIRLYGVVPVLVEDATTRLHPAVALPKEIRTDVPFEVKVSETDGKAMTYTLAIVDEGLLDLTRFKTPDPWAHFHAREALGVRTWDLYDQVIGAVGRQLQRVLAIGGSDQVDPSSAAKAQRFKPVVRFVGPFTLAKGKSATHKFTIDNYVGSVRAMVVATDGSRASGSAEATAPVRKPLMVLATLPRVIGPGETADLPVSVFAMDPAVKNVTVRIKASDAFVVEGGAERALTFSTTGDQLTTFRVKAAERIGPGSVEITATSGNEKATQRIDIGVRQAQQPMTVSEATVVLPGNTWNGELRPLGMPGTNSVDVEVSTLPDVDLGRRLQYLIQYPHGCVEQTTSGAFPQVFLADVIEVTDRTRATMRANVEAGLRRLRQYQLPNGGFSYWPGLSSADDWSSIWVGHFLVEAERAGFVLPGGMRAAWKTYMTNAARDHHGRSENGWPRTSMQLTQAYRLYVLALANSADLSAMNRLRTEPDLPERAKWMLAAAYGLNGRKDVARELVKGLTTTIPAGNPDEWTYGSDLRDAAIVAEALLNMDDLAGATAVITGIARDLGHDNWYSTQSTAWGLLAVSRLASAEQNKKAGMQFALTLDGNTTQRGSSKSVLRIDPGSPDKVRPIALRNTGTRNLYVRTIRTGTPTTADDKANSSGLVMEVRYEDMAGKRLDPASIAQGTDLQAIITVHHPGYRASYRNLALTQVFPSGWEIRNSRLEGEEGSERYSSYTYQDIRDDRVMTYFDLAPHQQVTYRVKLTAAYTGRYYLPGAQCSAMYDNTVNTRSAGGWVQVTGAGNNGEARR